MIPSHRYAEMFPLLQGIEYDELVADVRRWGIHDKIKYYEDRILDGRNRYRAGIDAGVIDPDASIEDLPALFERFIPEIDGDPLAFVRSRNIHRRHLSTSQRSYAMSLYEQYRHGGARRAASDQDANLQLENGGSVAAETRAELAEKAGVSERSIASAAVVRDHGITELKDAVRDGQIPVHAAERIARLPQEAQPEATAEALPNGNRAIMASRQESTDSLDFSPTPPWATRALIERVFPILGISRASMTTVHEPACGEGHMAEVLAEYFRIVAATDIHDYGYGSGGHDFLAPDFQVMADWIITNPPFKDEAEQFALKAIEQATVGVAIFARLQWLETIGRYERLFKDQPPTIIAFFCERVALHMGKWDPEGGTATAYIWLVWMKGHAPRAPFWIPPGQRKLLTRPDDAVRFTAHPVIKKQDLPPHNPETGEIIDPADGAGEPAEQTTLVPPGESDPVREAGFAAGSPAPSDDGLDIPSFLRREPAPTFRSPLE